VSDIDSFISASFTERRALACELARGIFAPVVEKAWKALPHRDDALTLAVFAEELCARLLVDVDKMNAAVEADDAKPEPFPCIFLPALEELVEHHTRKLPKPGGSTRPPALDEDTQLLFLWFAYGHRLADKQQRAFELHFVHNLTWEQVQEDMDYENLASLKSAYRLAVSNLKVMLVGELHGRKRPRADAQGRGSA
jgi:hypothetical protein